MSSSEQATCPSQVSGLFSRHRHSGNAGFSGPCRVQCRWLPGQRAGRAEEGTAAVEGRGPAVKQVTAAPFLWCNQIAEPQVMAGVSEGERCPMRRVGAGARGGCQGAGPVAARGRPPCVQPSRECWPPSNFFSKRGDYQVQSFIWFSIYFFRINS